MDCQAYELYIHIPDLFMDHFIDVSWNLRQISRILSPAKMWRVVELRNSSSKRIDSNSVEDSSQVLAKGTLA